MLIYLPIIFISVVFVYFAERFYKIKFLFNFFSAIALLILSVFAGCRDLIVGYDVLFYEYGIYQSAHYSNSFTDLLNNDAITEPVFLAINYIGVFLCDNIHFVLGLISFITSLFAYLACIRLKRYAPLWLLFSGYLLINYASSMNIMRQNVAVSLFFYTYTLLKDYGLGWRFYLMAGLTLFSHNSAIFPILILFFFYYIPKMAYKTYKFLIFCMIFFMILIYYSVDYILSYLTVFTQKDYTIYADVAATDSTWATLVIPYTYIIFVSLLAGLCIWKRKKELLLLVEWNEYKCTILVCILIFAMGATFTGSLLRLVAYFIILCIFYTIRVSYLSTSRRPQYLLRNILLLTLFVIMFFRTTSSSVDYSSRILNI